MVRKRYRDYKESNIIKFPLIAWIFNQPVLYLIFLVATLIAFAGMVHTGYASYNHLFEEPQKISPYQDIASAKSPAVIWASQLITKQPSGVDQWKVSEGAKPQHVISPSLCGSIGDVPNSLLATTTATGSGVETRIQVYGAGQAYQAFHSYIDALEKCGKVSVTQKEHGTVAVQGNTFMITMGDAIIGVTASNSEQRDILLQFYSTEMATSLQASQCVSLTVSPDDAKRSFFYDKDAYTGLVQYTELHTTVKIDNLPNPTSINLLEIGNPKAVEPEAPLPSGFPQLPATVTKPELPQKIADQTGFTDKAFYHVADIAGPGCGWSWSGQKSPVYDTNKLITEKNQSLESKQNELDKAAQEYVDSKLQWSFKMALTAPQADAWNNYVQQVDEVHSKWSWLITERNKIRKIWYSYVEQHNDWRSFDDRKAAASNTYNEKLQTCKTKQDELKRWEEQWGELYDQQNRTPVIPPVPEPSSSVGVTPQPTIPAPSPSPSVSIPPKPAGCTSVPERPAILDMDKPAEPLPPSIPEGVTIPNSWPQPQQ